MAGAAYQNNGKIQLWHKVLIGLIGGILFGLVLRHIYADIIPEFSKPLPCGEKYHYPGLLGLMLNIGTLFINLIKMIVVPLIFFSLISGITSISDSKTLGRVGKKATIAYLSTSAFAIVIGIGTALIFQPGISSVTKLPTTNCPPASIPTLTKVFMDIVPTNAIGAMAEGHTVQVVFFAIFVGVTLALMGDRGKGLVQFCQQCADVVFAIIGYIIQLSPYAVFALMAWVVGTQGLEALLSLVRLMITVVVACGVQFIVFGLIILLYGRLSPIPFFKKSLEYQMLAFSTSSSKATLATTIDVCQKKMGVSKVSSNFVLPLGAAINMDGTAIYLGVCAIFFAQLTGVHLELHQYLLIIVTATLGSIGAAGYPGGSIVMMPMVLNAVGLPIDGIALILGIDRLLDMLRTTVNITGDAAITVAIDKNEKTLDEDVYRS